MTPRCPGGSLGAVLAPQGAQTLDAVVSLQIAPTLPRGYTGTGAAGYWRTCAEGSKCRGYHNLQSTHTQQRCFSDTISRFRPINRSQPTLLEQVTAVPRFPKSISKTNNSNSDTNVASHDTRSKGKACAGILAMAVPKRQGRLDQPVVAHKKRVEIDLAVNSVQLPVSQ